MNDSEVWTENLTRREILTKIGQLGGAAALYETMVALGLINLPTAWAGPPVLPAGHGKSVLILGAGIGGLTAAYILSRYGYHCRILEATSRAGGRNRTARPGSSIVEQSEENGTTYQECKFDDGLYLNLGPGRIPYHHRRVLGYCQQLGIKLEPYVMNTTGNLFQSDEGFDGKPVVYREIQNDTRGFIAELLAKAVNQKMLDDEFTNEKDKQNLLQLLQSKFGPLNQEYHYEGSTRDGCVPKDDNPTPNVFDNCEKPDRRPKESLLKSEFWKNGFYSPFEFEWQSTLFQPVGGMDMIVEGFLRQIGNLVTYNAPVVEIQLDDRKVTVSYKKGSEIVDAEADYCVCNIPCPILTKIKNNFEDDGEFSFRKSIAHVRFAASCKVGWQSNSRFWESQYDIYGGISWTDDMIEQIWYPSNDYFGQKGTLTGAYIHDGRGAKSKNATTFGGWDLDKRLDEAKKGAAKLHQEFNDNEIVPRERGLSIAWQNIPFQEGAWASWGGDQHDDAFYQRLLRPDRNFHLVGDQASTLPGWQEGAMMSAEHVVELIAKIKSDELPAGIKAPNTLKVIQGHG